MSRRPSDPRPTLLLVTPALVGGSWNLISELAERIAGTMLPVVAAISPPGTRLPGRATYRVPWLDYEEFGPQIDRSLAAVIWFAAPLVAVSLLAWARCRPKIWLGNGLLSAALGIVPQKLTGGHVVISYNAYMGEDKPSRRLLARWIAKYASLVLVNSEGSRVDAEAFTPSDRVRVLPLCADDTFFSDGNPEALRKELGLTTQFVVAFVGRLDREKHCEFTLEVASRSEPGRIAFVFAGLGPMRDTIQAFASAHHNVLYLGRILDRSRLRDLYQMADLVWSYADETYLAKPAVEALAAGTPILVPDRPAILVKSARQAKIDPTLVPEDIGWIVSLDDGDTAARLLQMLDRNRERVAGMRQHCREFARAYHSIARVDPVVRELQSMIGRTPP